MSRPFVDRGAEGALCAVLAGEADHAILCRWPHRNPLAYGTDRHLIDRPLMPVVSLAEAEMHGWRPGRQAGECTLLVTVDGEPVSSTFSMPTLPLRRDADMSLPDFEAMLTGAVAELVRRIDAALDAQIDALLDRAFPT